MLLYILSLQALWTLPYWISVQLLSLLLPPEPREVPFPLSELFYTSGLFLQGLSFCLKLASCSLSDKTQVSLRTQSDSISLLHSLSLPLCLRHQAWSISSMTSVPCLSLMRLGPSPPVPRLWCLEPHMVRALMRALLKHTVPGRQEDR